MVVLGGWVFSYGRGTPVVKLVVRSRQVSGCGGIASRLQEYLANNKTTPSRTLQYAYALGPMAVLGGMRFLMSDVPL